MHRGRALIILLLLGLSLTAFSGENSQCFDAPKLTNITVDGDSSDWGDNGLYVGVMTTQNGDVFPAEDFNAAFRLGWNEDGLLLLVEVNDDMPVENESVDILWMDDSIELFVAPAVGARSYYQYAITPGRGPEQDAIRYKAYDFRVAENPPELAIEAASSATDTAYVVEACLPWSNLPEPPQPGESIGFQLFVTDSDPQQWRQQVQFYPIGTIHSSHSMHEIRLAEEAGQGVLAKALPRYDIVGMVLDIVGDAQLVGQDFEILQGGVQLAKAQFSELGGRAVAHVPFKPVADAPVSVTVPGVAIATADLAVADRNRALELIDESVIFEPLAFTGEVFPTCRFRNAEKVRDLLGDCQFETTFYNADYSEVDAAATPGRYGAVVKVTSSKGFETKRFVTLFRLPDAASEVYPWDEVGAEIDFPEAYGLDPQVVDEHVGDTSRIVWESFALGLEDDESHVKLLLGLYESAPLGRAATAVEGALPRDRQWWIGLKRKLYGADKRWPDPLVAPQEMDETATVLHEGSEADAGVKPGGVKQIDAFMAKWSEESEVPHAVCLSRNGVVFLHKAYGAEKDGTPNSVDTARDLASVAKLIYGVCMMMCLDDGRVSLDAPVEEYLPPFANRGVDKPLTIRRLYNHTHGLDSYWDDHLADIEERIADLYPYVPVGREYRYGSCGLALGWRIIELVSGEALPAYVDNHLVGPLGCQHTQLPRGFGGIESTPKDLALIGQLLLNRGAYSNMRFMSEETFEQALPRLVEIEYTREGQQRRAGVSLLAQHNLYEALSEDSFGHGGASGAQLIIDPAYGLVVSIIREEPGRDYERYLTEALELIVGSLE